MATPRGQREQGTTRAEALGLATAIAAGVVVGTLVALLGGAMLAVAAAGALVVYLALVAPEVAVVALIFITWTRLSDIAVTEHGLPSITQPLVLLLAIGAAVHWRRLGGTPPGMASLLLPTSLYLSAGVLSMVAASTLAESATSGLDLAKDAALAVLVVALVRTARTLHLVLWALLVAALLMSSVSLVQYVTSSYDNNFWGLAQAEVQNITGDTEGYRLGGTIGDPNYFAQVLLVVLPLGVHLAARSTGTLARVVAGLSVSLSAATIVLTFSRGAAVAAVLVAVLLLAHARHRVRVLIVCAVAALLLLPAVPPTYVDRIGTLVGSGDRGTEDVSFGVRGRALSAGLDMLADRPLLGVGLGRYEGEVAESYLVSASQDSARTGTAAHNLYLEVAAETGIIGLTAFLALVALAFQALSRGVAAARGSGDQQLAETLWTLRLSLVGYLAAAMFIHAAYGRYLWLLLGLAFATIAVVDARTRTGASTR